MPTKTRSSPKIQARWQTSGATPRLKLVREGHGGRDERNLGPRSLLDLDEAAAVLQRPRAEVERAIRTGFLAARREGRMIRVTVGACYRFLAEERADGQAARSAIEEMKRTGAKPIPAEQVYRELGLE